MTRQRGQAMVEFALIGILLLLLFFVLIDGARAVYAYQTVGEATREGLHSGELIQSSDAQIRTAINSHSGYLGPLGNSATITPATNRTIGANVTITVTYQYRMITPFLGGFGPINISSTSATVVE